MKKIVAIITVAAGLLSAACAKQESPLDSSIRTNQEPSLKEVVFTSQSEPTKTTYDSGAVNWVAGDEITILWGTGESDKTVSAAVTGGATTGFRATVGEADMYYAVYPSAIVSSLSGLTEYDLLVNVPKTQHGLFANANIAVASTDAASMSLAFQNLCSLGKFQLTRSDIKEVRFRGNNGEAVNGDGVQVKLGETPSVEGVGTPHIETVVTPSEGTAFAPGTYYVAILPGRFSQGFYLSCKTTADVILPLKYTTQDYNFPRSTAIDLGVIDNTDKLYVTPDGTGNGSTWSKAMGTAALRNLLSDLSETPEADRIRKINNTIICLAGGTYALADETAKYLPVSFTQTVKLSLEGGYNAGTGERDFAQETILSGNSANALFSIGDKVDITFDGIVFRDARTMSLTVAADINKGRGALTVTSSSAIVNVNYCKFLDNVEAITHGGDVTTGYDGGAALYVSSGKVYVKNSLFKDNSSSSRGGAVRTETGGTLFMDNCQFIDNCITYDAYGTALFTKGNLGLHRCTFYGGSAPSGKNNPILNVNNNFILSSNTIVGTSSMGSGTGLVRSETTGTYRGLLVDNILVNTYSGSNTAWGILISKTDKANLSFGYNLFSGKNNGVSHPARIDLQTSDKDVTDYTTLGPTGLNLNTTTYTIDWTGAWTGYTPADATTVKTAIESHTVFGSDFSTWLGL